MRKVAVFNDTSPSRHFGCEAVMAAIEANVARRNAGVSYRHPYTKPWQADSSALAAIDEADVVVVNGEGTIHHGKPAAANLVQLGPHCRARGKPCFLINATIQANPKAVMEDIGAFDAVWVRERQSAEEARRWRIGAELCGDLSFFHELPHHSGGSARGLVLDSASLRTTAEMARIAAVLKADFVTMRHNKKGMKAYKKQALRWRYESGKPDAVVSGICTFQQFASFLARRPFLVTGRFHGLCFAVNARVPFSAVPLLVWKSVGLLSDLGLDPARVFQADTMPNALTSRELELISAYLADIRYRIAAMFDQMLPRQP